MSGPATSGAREPAARYAGGGWDSGVHVAATLLSATAVLASAAPLGQLFTATPWWPTAFIAVAAVAIIGLAMRVGRFGPSATAVAQLAGLILLLSVAFPPADPLLGGLVPGPATLGHWRDLLVEAAHTITQSAAPAPAPPGIAFVVAAAIGIVAWAVDVVAVGSRMPAVAGLPLLTPYLTAVANNPGTLGVVQVVAPLALFAAMLIEQERDWLTTWRPDLARTHRLPARGGRLSAGVALVVVAVLVGLGAAAVVPHLPQRYLAEGLGRGGTGGGNRVGFSPDSDLLASLRSGDRTPILQYSSDDPESPPLRVSVASSYAEGRWTTRQPTATASQSPTLPRPVGLTDQVPRREAHLRVSQTTLEQPYLASPVPIVGGTVVGAQWNVDEVTAMPVVDVMPRSYNLTYLALDPTPEALAALARPTQVPRSMRDNLTVPQEVDTAAFRAALNQAVGEATAPYAQAVRIQSWLRDAGGFTYSLDLAPVPAGMDDATAKRTAVDRFLKSKQGYCVQFATTMALMARQLRIPARLASGFLPGADTGGGQRTVVAADAHAWPELYFDGVGWLRFEPTPSVRSGPVPRYAGGVGAPTPTTATSSTLTATTTVSPTSADPNPRRDPNAQEDLRPAPDEVSPWWSVLRVVGALAVLAAIVPALAAGVRARRRARTRSAGEAAEAEWLILAERLEDLGLEVPAAATPRQLHARLTDTAVLDRPASGALRRVLLAVEDARYARPDPGAAAADAGAGTATHSGADFRADARTVYREAAAMRSPGVRVRAALLPRAGLRALHLPVPGHRARTPRH